MMIGFPWEICSQVNRASLLNLKILFLNGAGWRECKVWKACPWGGQVAQAGRWPKAVVCMLLMLGFHLFVGNTALVAANLLFEMLCVLLKWQLPEPWVLRFFKMKQQLAQMIPPEALVWKQNLRTEELMLKHSAKNVIGGCTIRAFINLTKQAIFLRVWI